MISQVVKANVVGAVAICVGTSLVLAEPATGDAAKKPTKAELGAMLKKCSDEADTKGLTVQKGKGDARKTYRRQCMLKNGVSPRAK